jgi:hypothetical protein
VITAMVGSMAFRVSSALGEDDARRDLIEAVPELGVVGRDQAVGRADRRGRDPGGIGAQGHQGVLDRVARQDHDAVPRAQAAIQQPLGDALDRPQRLAVGYLAPGAVARLALLDVGPVRMLGGLAGDQVGDRARAFAGGMVRGDDHRAVGTPIDGDVGPLHGQRLERNAGNVARRRRAIRRRHGSTPSVCSIGLTVAEGRRAARLPFGEAGG